ncbi:MAG: LVIVD repeat-containing protein [Candidatus Heimdallarchaeota archaeon]
MTKKIFSSVIFVSLISAMILILTVQTSSSLFTNNISTSPAIDIKNLFEGAFIADDMLKLGQWDESIGNAVGSCIRDDLLYVAADKGGLAIFNISDLSNPEHIGQYMESRSNAERSIFVRYGYAFIADLSNGLVVLDVSNPEDITFVTNYDNGLFLSYFTISNNLTYLADEDNIIVVNITDPTNLEYVGSYIGASGYIQEILISGDIAYLANAFYGLEILNISNPTAITQISTFDPGGLVYGLIRQGDYIITVGGYSAMYVIDVSDKENPFVATTVAEGVSKVAKYGNYLLAEHWHSVDVYDISTPTSLTVVANVGITYGITNLYQNYGILVVMDYYHGVEIIDLTNILSPISRSFYSFGGEIYDVAVKGNFAYTANQYGGLSVIDISNTANPIEVNNIQSSTPRKITIVKNYAYIADDTSGFTVYDLTNPTSPSLIFREVLFGSGLGVVVRGDYAFVGLNEDGLRIYDISNKNFIHSVGEVTDGGYTHGVYLKDNIAYCADSSAGLEVIDISDVTNPVEIAEFGGRCYDVDGVWNYLLTLESSVFDLSLRIYDVSTPNSPVLLSTFALDYPVEQIDVHGDWAFISSQFGFEVINWYDLLHPTSVGFYYDNGFAHGADIVNGTYYVADGWDGLEILTLDLPDSDNDRLPDSIETGIYGTEPLVNDTDGDRFLDGEETDLIFTIPSLADTDSDGFDDYTEWINGSDPRDPTSTPVLSGPSFGIIILSTALVLTGAKIIKTKRKRKE